MIEEILEHLSNCWLTQVIVGTTVVGISIAFYLRQSAAARLAKLRVEWDGRDKDVVTLHMFDRALTCPNPSPFPIKLETYLRMAKIKYVPDFEEPMSSKGKSPWITINGKDIADSQLAIEYLAKELNKDIESHLSPGDKVKSRALIIMLEEHFYWCLVMERWVISRAEDLPQFFPPTIFAGFLPGFVISFLYRQFGSRTMVPQAKAAGIGRHSEDEIYKLAFEDLEAISTCLGNKAFLLGDQPCLADLTLFGFICMMTCLPKDSKSKLKEYLEKNCQTLLRHHKTMVEKYWPDYETARYKA